MTNTYLGSNYFILFFSFFFISLEQTLGSGNDWVYLFGDNEKHTFEIARNLITPLATILNLHVVYSCTKNTPILHENSYYADIFPPNRKRGKKKKKKLKCK